MTPATMKLTHTLLTALLLAPLAVFSQAMPEVANATKAAKRAWESAPAETKALWQQQREALTHIDLSEDTQRQIVIARGSPEPGAYHAHPTTAMLADCHGLPLLDSQRDGGSNPA
jgi:hypothetical protein